MNQNTTHADRRRHWPMEGAFNVRDVGGYPTVDGHSTRWRALLRSDSLHKLSANDQALLQAADVHRVIDLRYSQEATRAPNVYARTENGAADVQYFNVELLPGSVSAGVIPEAALREPPTSLEGVYNMLLDHCQPALNKAVGLVADAPAGAVIIHCTLGKDRTGILTALLLGAVGVDDQTIINDYALTGEYVQDLLPGLRAQALADGRDPVIYERMIATDPVGMANALRHLHEKYGSAVDYLHQIGITDDQIATLRARLVE